MLDAYSPSGSEAELSKLLLEEMGSNGLEASIDDAGDVIGEVGHEGPRILLCGHMDTVPGRLPVSERDGFIYGRGAVDAKASLAAMIVGCINAMNRKVVPFRATVVGVVEEETSSKGIMSIASKGTPYDLAVFGEPSGTSNIIVGYKGSVRLEVTCHTSGGHSSSPWLSKNSLEEAFEFWKSLREALLENDSPSRFEAITGSLVNATGSPGGNSIPSKSTLEIDLRLPPRTNPREVIGRVERFKAEYARSRAAVRINTVFTNETKAFLGGNDSLGVRAFRYAIRRITGDEVQLVRKTGTSDLNIFSETCKSPMVAYGPGDSSLDHTNLERVQLADYIRSIDVYATAIERFATLAARPLAPVDA